MNTCLFWIVAEKLGVTFWKSEFPYEAASRRRARHQFRNPCHLRDRHGSTRLGACKNRNRGKLELGTHTRHALRRVCHPGSAM